MSGALSPAVTSGLRTTSSPLPQIDLYAGALFVHICLGWNFYLSTTLMLAITALYTIAGTAPSRGSGGGPRTEDLTASPGVHVAGQRCAGA